MSLPPLHELDAWQTAALLARRELKAETLARACLERVAERDGDVHAFAHLDVNAVLAQARALDAGAAHGPLHGLPLGVKDLFDTADLPTTYGSPIYAGHRPAADAASVTLCREAGALVLGKTVTTEFAYFSPGPTANPHNPAHTPGGSSSGSAAAVAAGMVPLALGTQTAGSIIRPAAYCGVVGYKPSLGRTSTAGVKSLSRTLDVAGGFGRSVRDVGLLGAALTGDARLMQWGDDPGAPRIGLLPTPAWEQADADTQGAWAQAARVLSPQTTCRDAQEPADFGELIQLQKDIMAFEMARNLSHERVAHRARLSPQLNDLLDTGMRIDGATHAANLARTQAWRQRIDALFDSHDVLLTPSATGEAPAGLKATGDPLFCRSWSLLGLPCVHLPFATGHHGLPVGLQVVGRHGQDHLLLAAAHWIHQRLKG